MCHGILVLIACVTLDKLFTLAEPGLVLGYFNLLYLKLFWVFLHKIELCP